MSAFRDLRLIGLHVTGYGRLHDYVLEPPHTPGVLVVAPNEAGKSTVCSALFRGLFGFPDKAQEDLRRPWGGGPFQVRLEWSCGPDLRCTIERDFDRQSVTVEWRRVVPGVSAPVLERRWEGTPNPRGRSSDRATYQAELRRLLGFTSSDVFRQTAYVGPGDPGLRLLAGELLRILSGSDRTDFRTALVEFETHYYDLTQRDIRGSGRPVKQKARRLETLEAERAELVRRHDAAITARAARREAEESLERARARMAEIEQELADRERAGGAFRRLAELGREIEAAEARKDELDRAIGRFLEWEKRVREKTAELEPCVRYLHLPRDFPERLRRMAAIDEGRRRLVREANELRVALAAEPGATPEAATGVAGVAFLITALVLALAGISTWAVAAAVTGVATLGAAWWLRHRRRARRQGLLVEWSGIESQIAGLEAEHRERAMPLPPGIDARDVDAEIEHFERAQRLRAELDGMQAARHALGDRQSYERERRQVKEERLDVLRLEQRKLIEAHPYLDWGPDYERQFAVERERLTAEKKRLEQEELAKRRALADVGRSEEDPLRLEAEIVALDGEIEQLALDRDAFRLAFETLTACKDEFVRVMTQRLQRRIGRVFEGVTGGRYDAVEIDPVTLELTVHGIEKRGVPAESLSRGTRDQLFFALRVAILEELSADRALPVVLDDPFLHFDRERLALVEETLSRLGESHQILIFTHDARLAGWAFPKQLLPALAMREEVPASGG